MMCTSLSLPIGIPVDPVRVVNEIVHFRSNASVWIQLTKCHVVCPDEKTELGGFIHNLEKSKETVPMWVPL